jgi:hypothetical protein
MGLQKRKKIPLWEPLRTVIVFMASRFAMVAALPWHMNISLIIACFIEIMVTCTQLNS